VQKMSPLDVQVDNILFGSDHVFDLSPWPRTLLGESRKWRDRPWIRPEVLNGPDAPYEVCITAVNAVTTRLEYFSNRDPGGLRLEHILASFSIPLWYGPTEIDGVPYWDGGTMANTPFRRALEMGGTEIVVVTMVPWPERPVYSFERHGFIDDLFEGALDKAQKLWNAFEPALDAMLTETVWRDYLLFDRERQDGDYPNLEWLSIVAPNQYLTVGLMTHYDPGYHRRLFTLGYKDANDDLAEVLPLP
jgi:NTE family protein